MLRSAAAALSAVSPRGSPGGNELGEQGMQPVDGLRPGADQIVAVFGQNPQGRDGLIDNRGAEPGGSVRRDADRQGVGLVGFAAVPGGQQPDAPGQLGRHVDHVDTVGRQPGRQRGTKACCAFDRPDRMGPAVGEAAQLPVAGTIDLDADRGQGLQSFIDRDSGPGRLVRIDGNDNRRRHRGQDGGHGLLLAGPGEQDPARRADQLRA